MLEKLTRSKECCYLLVQQVSRDWQLGRKESLEVLMSFELVCMDSLKQML